MNKFLLVSETFTFFHKALKCPFPHATYLTLG